MSAWVTVDRLCLEQPPDALTDLPDVARDALASRTERIVEHVVGTLRGLPGAGLVVLGARLAPVEGPDVEDARRRLHRGLQAVLDAGHRVLVDPGPPARGELPAGCELLGPGLRLPTAPASANGCGADATTAAGVVPGAGLVASSRSWGDLARYSLEPVVVRDVLVDARSLHSVEELAVRLGELAGHERGPVGPLTVAVLGRALVTAPAALRARLAWPGVAERLIASVRLAGDPAASLWWERMQLLGPRPDDAGTPPLDCVTTLLDSGEAGEEGPAPAVSPGVIDLAADLLSSAPFEAGDADPDDVSEWAGAATDALHRAVTSLTATGPAGPLARLDEAERCARARLDGAGTSRLQAAPTPEPERPGHGAAFRPALLGVTTAGVVGASGALVGGRNALAVGLGSLAMVASLGAFVTSPRVGEVSTSDAGAAATDRVPDDDDVAAARAARLELALTERRRSDLETRVATWREAADLITALVAPVPSAAAVP